MSVEKKGSEALEIAKRVKSVKVPKQQMMQGEPDKKENPTMEICRQAEGYRKAQQS